MPQTRKDERTGVVTTISTGYEDAEYCPGAVTVPSHDGDFGKQVGVDRNTPLDMVETNEDGSVVETSSKASRRSTAKPAPRRKTSGAKTKPAAKTAAQPVAATPAAATPSDLSAVADVVRAVLRDELQGDDLPVATSPVDTAGDVEPRLMVSFSSTGLGEIVVPYHDAVVQHDILVLAYNTSWRYGSRYTPPVDPDNKLVITLQPSDGGDALTYNCGYPGISFTAHGYTYTVFVIATE